MNQKNKFLFDPDKVNDALKSTKSMDDLFAEGGALQLMLKNSMETMLKAELEEHPGDPALLINLGIAYAQNGSTAEARKSFEAALASREVVELETANGTATDSRRLARRALAMLSRGEFRPSGAGSDRLTLNQR